jgi:hypothetical protein
MSNIKQGTPGFCLRTSVATLILFGAATIGTRAAHAQGAAATPPAQSEAKGTAKSADKSSVKDHIKQLGKEVSDPGTLQRIKGHEQEAEKKVERIRDRQRKDHGRARPDDAVDLAKSVDKPEGGSPAKADRTSTGTPKKKGEGTGAAPPAPPAPAATKPSP